MKHLTSARRLSLAYVLLLLVAVPTWAAPNDLCGYRNEVDGVTTLKLWGKPFDRGFAHGYLLADEIVDMINNAILHPDIMPSPQVYEQQIRPMLLPQFKFPAEREEELNGILAGVIAKLGPHQNHITRLQRDIVLDDLKALNTFADWAGLFCSSFSAWGEMTADGNTITARNLDYRAVPPLQQDHVVFSYIQEPGGKLSYVSVAWPGVIGVYTAINEKGVTISIHDTPNPAKQHGPFKPRSITLAELIETAKPETALDQVESALRHNKVACGNNVHVSVPYHEQDVPAAVFEWDSNLTANGGVVRRTAANNLDDALRACLMCTNHQRLRVTPKPGHRYRSLMADLRDAKRRGKKIDSDLARKIIADTANDQTLHTVVFEPNRLRFHASFALPDRNAIKGRVHTFDVGKLLRKPFTALANPARPQLAKPPTR